MSSQGYMAATTDDKGIGHRNHVENETFLDKLKRNRRLVAVVSILLLLAVFLFVAFTIFNNSSSDEENKLKKSLNITETNTSNSKVLETIAKSNEIKKVFTLDKIHFIGLIMSFQIYVE